MSRDIHDRLTSIVDNHLGSRPTMPVEALLDALEKELPALIAQTREDAIAQAVQECERELRACELLAKRFPKNQVHATGVLIADVCRRRVRALLGEDDES